jgi:cysteine desulfurase
LNDWGSCDSFLGAMPNNKIYLDYNATTPLNDSLLEHIPVWLEAWGNPSSIHWAGRGPKTLLRESRESLAKALNCNPLEIIFTSGGSEANNLAIRGVFENALLKGKKPDDMHFITSKVEHPSVVRCFQFLQALGARVDYVDVSRTGILNIDQFAAFLKPGTTLLISIMYANNETGNIFPIKELAQMAHEAGALVHSDCVQAFGKSLLDLRDLAVDLATISAHKYYALKGTGCLYVRRNVSLSTQILGGGQERRRRGGTENVLGIQAMGWMTRFLPQLPAKEKNLRALRVLLEGRILQEISGVQLTGVMGPRLPNTSSFVIDGIDGETLLMRLDLAGFAVSTGAACSSGNPEPSPVLLAMGLKREEAQSSLRVSLGWPTTESEIHCFVDELKKTVGFLRQLKQESRYADRRTVILD